MLAGISLLNPIGGLGQDVVGWLGHAISEGIGSFASWAIGGVIHAMSATTTPNFASWFKGPWRAMLSVVAWLSIPVLFFGVGTAALRGDLTSVLRRGLGAPVIMALATAVTLPVTAGLLTLVNGCCGLLVEVAIGGNQGFGRGLGQLSTFALSATVVSGGNALPGLAAALIVAVAGLAALVIWFVLALRGALLYLEVLAIPLALCGLYWGGTAHWIKRLVDLIVATILSQLVITMLMVLAAAALDNGQLSVSRFGQHRHDDAVLSGGLSHPRVPGPAHGPQARARRHRACRRGGVADQRAGTDHLHGEPDRRHHPDDGPFRWVSTGDRAPSRGGRRSRRCGRLGRGRCGHDRGPCRCGGRRRCCERRGGQRASVG